MAKQPDRDWRQQVIDMLPKMEATGMTEQTTGGFTPATATDFGPVTFYGDRTPSDPTELLDGLPLVKITALKQRAFDLHAQLPTYEQVQEVRLEALGYANRITHLTKAKGEGGFGLPDDAPQVVVERGKLERAEQELARLTELKETRTVRWNAAGQLRQSVGDWVLRGVPGDCVLETLEDAPLSELLKKGETIATAVERYRHRLRELAADLHRVRSSPWPSSLAKAAARELIDRLADAGQPNLDGAIEHGQPISFASMRMTSLVHNVEARGAIAYAETPDAIGTLCWLFKDQLLAKINAGFDEIADDKSALSQQQREEMEAQIASDMLSAERSECALIWHAEAKGEVIDFRSTTSAQAALGVSLRTVPRAALPPTSPGHGYDIVRR